MNNTTQPKHTPGPYSVSDETPMSCEGLKGFLAIEDNGPECACFVAFVPPNFVDGVNCQDANARLFAGSPELLAAASALSAAYLDAEPTKAKADAWIRLRAAIRAAS